MAEEKNETSPVAEGEKTPQDAGTPPKNGDDESTKEIIKDDAVIDEKEKKIEENGDSEKPKENGEEKTTPETKDMRAIVLNGFGGLKSVKALKKPEPALAEGEVLIRVKAWWVAFVNSWIKIYDNLNCARQKLVSLMYANIALGFSSACVTAFICKKDFFFIRNIFICSNLILTGLGK